MRKAVTDLIHIYEMVDGVIYASLYTEKKILFQISGSNKIMGSFNDKSFITYHFPETTGTNTQSHSVTILSHNKEVFLYFHFPQPKTFFFFFFLFFRFVTMYTYRHSVP